VPTKNSLAPFTPRLRGGRSETPLDHRGCVDSESPAKNSKRRAPTTIEKPLPFGAENGTQHSLYDVLGRRLVALVDERQAASCYSVTLDARMPASDTCRMH
jgi:hypothetical protein